MGALPKRRISKRRKGNRRSHNALAVPALSVCPKCKKVKRPHFKCAYCGFYGEYKGKTAVVKEVVEKVTTAKAEKPVAVKKSPVKKETSKTPKTK